MAKPVIFTVDDDPGVLLVIERDLRKHFGKTYRVLRADSGHTALEALRKLLLRNEPVALLLADQRMPGMDGVEFLQQAREMFPDTRRVLLTAYADTDAAIKAINDVKLDYYLQKPWEPPEERLFPVLQELLDDWFATFRPKFVGLRIIGNRWSPKAHEIKDFLARNQIPYRWLDIESGEEAGLLLKHVDRSTSDLPIVVLEDGSHLLQPTTTELAEKIGLRTRSNTPNIDLIIVGAGPAGLGAGVYSASEGLTTLMIERSAPGGQAGQSSNIENYLGFPNGLSGAELTRRALTQAERFGAELLRPQEVLGLRVEDSYKFVKLGDGSEVQCRALVIATGISYRRLEVPGVEALTGAGIYYGAAITEAISCRDNAVYVVGAGNSAGQAAIYLSEFASQVTMLVRGESLVAGMSKYLIDRIIDAHPKIIVRLRTHVTAAHGDGNLQALTLNNLDTGAEEKVVARAMFIFIGAVPHTDWVAGVVNRDEHGFIPTGPDLMLSGKRPKGWMLDRDPYFLESNVPGVFVAGDVRRDSVKRVASAVGEGAMSVAFVHKYLATL